MQLESAATAQNEQQLAAVRQQLAASERCTAQLQDQLSEQQVLMTRQLHQLQSHLRDKDAQLKVLSIRLSAV